VSAVVLSGVFASSARRTAGATRVAKSSIDRMILSCGMISMGGVSFRLAGISGPYPAKRALCPAQPQRPRLTARHTIRERCFSQPAAVIITSARTPGRVRPLRTTKRGCSNGRSCPNDSDSSDASRSLRAAGFAAGRHRQRRRHRGSVGHPRADRRRPNPAQNLSRAPN
jgi:hypothetical protein